MTNSWRGLAEPIISEVIARVGRDDEKALRDALRDAYPFGERAHWPYKVWGDEVRRQIDGRRLVGDPRPKIDDRTPDFFSEDRP